MSKTTTVNTSQGFAMVHPAPDGSLQLTVARNGVGTTIIGLTRESAAIIGRALTGTPAPHLENARFEDVQAGDVVRTEWTYCGMKLANEGIAHHQRFSDWRTEEDGGLGCDDALEHGGTITILTRPTPQLPTEPRSVILVEADGDWVPMILDADGDWAALSKTGREGYWSSVDIAARGWKLAKVVEA